MASRKARDWDKTIAKVFAEVPAAKDVDWEALFRSDPAILGDLVNDIIKVNVSQKGRPGKRSIASAGEVEEDLRRLNQEDYTELPLPRALSYQLTERSYRQIANSSGLDKMTIHRLSKGKGPPATIEQMEKLAKAIKKEPTYFLEYRAAYICAALFSMLMESGDAATIFYKKLQRMT